MMQTEWRRESLVMAQDVVAHAKKRGITPGQFATAWVLANPLITAKLRDLGVLLGGGISAIAAKVSGWAITPNLTSVLIAVSVSGCSSPRTTI